MKKNILFITSQNYFQQLANLLLAEAADEYDVSFCKSLSESIEILSGNQKFSLIFLGHKITLDDELKNLTQALLPHINNEETKIQGTNKALKEKDWATYYHEFTPAKNILLRISECLLPKRENSEYITFPILALLDFEEYPFNCFFKIKKSSGISFLQVYRKNELTDMQSVLKYKDKGAKLIYVKRDEIETPIDDLSQKILKEKGLESNADPGEALAMSAEYASEILKSSGMDIPQKYVNVAQTSFKQTETIINDAGENKSLIKQLLSQKEEFYFKLVGMTSLVSCYMLDEMKLNDRNLKEKLCFASFFQNIFLNNQEELIVAERADLSHFSPADQKRINSHAFMAFELLRDNPNADTDILKIIKEHHGHSTGIEITDSINSTLKISLIFQMASYFSQQFLFEFEAKGKSNPFHITQKLQTKLNSKTVSLLKSMGQITTDLSSVQDEDAIQI